MSIASQNVWKKVVTEVNPYMHFTSALYWFSWCLGCPCIQHWTIEGKSTCGGCEAFHWEAHLCRLLQCTIRFHCWKAMLVCWGLCTPFSHWTDLAHGVMLSIDRSSIPKTTSWAHRFPFSFLLCIWWFIGNHYSPCGSPRSTMVHHVMRNKKMVCAIKQNIKYAQ